MIQLQNLSFSYGRKKPLFDQIDLLMPAGHIYGLLGKNGAGKSTLLKLIAGLLFPSQGDIRVMGFIPGDRHPHFLREIYIINEEFELPPLTIDQYVRLYSPFYPRFDRELLFEYLKEFNLDTHEKLAALSYGQRKNFLVSFGLATDCRLLILDEPTNGLDIPSKSKFRKIVANAIDEERSFIISTHQVRDMENLIDPLIILDEGEIVFFEDYERISRKLAITRQSEIVDENSLVYYESYLGGYTVVAENTTREETSMNLEIIFNAVVSNKEKIGAIFNR